MSTISPASSRPACSRCPNRMADDPNADVYADAWARAQDWPVEIVAPPLARPREEDGEPIAASYMNFYIGNAAVVVPLHGRPE